MAAPQPTSNADHEARLGELGVRKSRGSYYTPADVIDGLLRICLDPIIAKREADGADAVASIRVLDPTCGTGHFLLAVVDRVRASLARLGVTRDTSVALAVRTVAGVDLDAEAVDICRETLAAVAGPGARAELERRIRCDDSLLMPRYATETLFAVDEVALDWQTFMTEVDAAAGFDAVVGNPPFLGQLQRETMFDAPYLDALKHRFADAARSYVDPAALFLLVGLDVLNAAGGRLCLIQPLSVLATRGAAGVRQSLLARAVLQAVWFAEEQVFDAATVDVWAPLLHLGARLDEVDVFVGRDVSKAGTVDPPDSTGDSWGSLLASRTGVPTRRWATAGTVGSIASATADFRDQYYGLADHLIEQYEDAPETPKLVTSGLIDPAQLLWGERDTTVHRKRYRAPRVDLARLSDELRRWARRRLVPKVLVATQTRVLEPVVDVDGVLLPSVPVVTVEPPPDALWRVAALLVSPPIVAIAAARHLGAALSADALKLSARDVLALPLPAGTTQWAAGAAAFERASRALSERERYKSLIDCAEAMCAAYGAADDHELMRWWLERLPRSMARDDVRPESTTTAAPR